MTETSVASDSHSSELKCSSEDAEDEIGGNESDIIVPVSDINLQCDVDCEPKDMETDSSMDNATAGNIARIREYKHEDSMLDQSGLDHLQCRTSCVGEPRAMETGARLIDNTIAGNTATEMPCTFDNGDDDHSDSSNSIPVDNHQGNIPFLEKLLHKQTIANELNVSEDKPEPLVTNDRNISREYMSALKDENKELLILHSRDNFQLTDLNLKTISVRQIGHSDKGLDPLANIPHLEEQLLQHLHSNPLNEIDDDEPTTEITKLTPEKQRINYCDDSVDPSDANNDGHGTIRQDIEQIRQELLCITGTAQADLQTEAVDEDSDLGLKQLFDEPQEGSVKQCKGARSKSSKKRKKQQLKLAKPASDNQKSQGRYRFAESFKEIRDTTLCFDDIIPSDITCSICLELYYLPTVCTPCQHVFCDPCLRRLTTHRTEGIPCPLCRSIIDRCDLDKLLTEHLLDVYTELYTYRGIQEQNCKIRHQQLPFTPPVPLGKRLLRHIIASRNNQSNTDWMSHDWFKFLLGCTAGICLSLLIMLLNRVKSINDVRDVNIMFLSCVFGILVTVLIFKFFKIS